MTILTPTDIRATSYWFLFSNNQLLIRRNQEQSPIPLLNQTEVESLLAEPPQLIGHINEISCYAGIFAKEARLPDRFTFAELRPLFGQLDECFFGMAGKAAHLLHWRARTRFCGLCGAKTKDKTDECAQVCEACGEIYYPRIAPAIIVAIIKDGQILLARANRFTTPFYSVIAGFVEPGESLEECVRREVMEEVGIRVKNIRYFHSQPWPFPDSLMVGFIADYAGGEIVVDLKENQDAGWYAPDNLPPIPGRVSIARRLIDWFLAEYGQH
jgi:NAD+ diphosphatase